MKVLIVTTGYPCNPSDFSGIFIRRLALAMIRSGAKVTVLAPGSKHAKARESDCGIEVIRFTYAPRPFMRIAYGSGGIPENLRHSPWLVFLMPLFLVSLAINALMLARSYDVIHANWIATGLLCLPAKWFTKKPLLVTIRGMDFKRGKFSLMICSFLTHWADALTTVNRQWAEELNSRFGAGKVHYTPNGVEAVEKVDNLRTRLGISINQTIVLFMGVISFRKGADILAKAAKMLVDTDNSPRFLVVGPGDPAKFNLRDLPNVTCIGPVTPHQALTTYAQCDIFVLPSRHEGRPNVLLEAMAAGLPSVATKLPGILEVLTPECGIVVDVEDPSALANAIHALTINHDMRLSMGKRARSRIEELSLDWDTSARRYLKLFRRVSSCVA
jgi:glycosyltransferase involved in cell wall biosynthesis